MKRLFYLMLVVLGTAAFTACSDDDDNDNGGGSDNSEGIITLMSEAEEFNIGDYYDSDNFWISTPNGGDVITIDWGDGITEEYASVAYQEEGETYYRVVPKHSYEDNKYSHSVTIKGNILRFYSFNDRITSLNVSKCPQLIYLFCVDSDLTNLDVTKNTLLEYLILELNELISLDISKCPALKELVCDNNEFTAEEMNKIYNALPVVESGTLACDELGDWSIAEKKGWTGELY